MKDPIKDSLDKIRLLESQQVDEYSADQLGTDANAALRGFGHGLSFGFDDNIRAGLDRVTGQEKDYKTALQKQMAKTADLKAKASSTKFNITNPFTGNKHEFNPSVYDAGELGGFAANNLIPGSIGAKAIGNAATKGIGKVASKGIANTVGKGVGTVGGVGLGLGANVGASVGTGMAKDVIDTSVTGVGQALVDRLAKMNPEFLKSLQSQLKVAPSGKLDSDTLNALAGISLKETRKYKSKILSELERINEGNAAANALTADTAKGLEKILGVSAVDLLKMSDKDFNALVATKQNLTTTPSGIVIPRKDSAPNFGPNRPPTTTNAPTQFDPTARSRYQPPPGTRTEPRAQAQAEITPPGTRTEPRAQAQAEITPPGNNAANSRSRFRRRDDRVSGGGGGGGGGGGSATGGSATGGSASVSGIRTGDQVFHFHTGGGSGAGTTITRHEFDQGLSELLAALRAEQRTVPAGAASSLRAAENAARETGDLLPLTTWWDRWGGVVKYSAAVMAVIGGTWLAAVLLKNNSSDGGGGTTPQIGPEGGGGAGGGGAGGGGAGGASQVDPNDLEELHALMKEIATYDDAESKALYAEYQELLANNPSLKPSSGSTTGPTTVGGSSTARDYGRDSVRLAQQGAGAVSDYFHGAWDQLLNPKE